MMRRGAASLNGSSLRSVNGLGPLRSKADYRRRLEGEKLVAILKREHQTSDRDSFCPSQSNSRMQTLPAWGFQPNALSLRSFRRNSSAYVIFPHDSRNDTIEFRSRRTLVSHSWIMGYSVCHRRKSKQRGSVHLAKLMFEPLCLQKYNLLPHPNPQKKPFRKECVQLIVRIIVCQWE
jgi:hypothetical protein